MTIRTVETQSDLDAALADSDIDTIRICSPAGVPMKLSSSGSTTVHACDSTTVTACDSTTVRAYDSGTVRAYGSGTVHAYDSGTVRAYGSGTVRAYDSTTVHAYGSGTVHACDSTTVHAWDSTTVRAYDSTTVHACDSTTVHACDSTTVRAYGSGTVHAYDSTTVTACGSTTVRAYGSTTVRACDSGTVHAYGSTTVHAYGSTTVTARDSCTITAGPHVAVHLHSTRATVTGGIIIDLTRLDLNDPQTWTEHYGVRVIDGRALLYKALPDDLTMGAEYGHPTVYAVGAELSCTDWRDDNTCGGGYHLSPSPAQASHYHRSATRWVRCTVALADLRPINDSGTAKCKARTLRVEAEVDAYGCDVLRLLAVCTTCGATTDGAAECDQCAIDEETMIKRREDR